MPRKKRRFLSPPASSSEGTPTGGIAGGGSAPEAIEIGTLRAAVVHLVELAAAYELSADPSKDPGALQLLQDLLPRIQRHMVAQGRSYLISSLSFVQGNLRNVYTEYLGNPLLEPDALRAKVSAVSFGQLTDAQLRIASPTRDRLRAQGGPAQFAKEIVGEMMAGITGRQMHTWTKAALTMGVPGPFQVEVGASTAAKYVLESQADALMTISGEVTESERVLRETLGALERAHAASQLRVQRALSSSGGKRERGHAKKRKAGRRGKLGGPQATRKIHL